LPSAGSPCFPSIREAGAAALAIAWERKFRVLLAGIGLAAVVAMASAIPVLRPLEYYNEMVGGTGNAWHHLSDESLESGQRTKELAAYYHQYLEPKGEIPYVEYSESYLDDRREYLPCKAPWKAHPETDTSARTSIEWSRRGMHRFFACFRPALRDERLALRMTASGAGR